MGIRQICLMCYPEGGEEVEGRGGVGFDEGAAEGWAVRVWRGW